MSVLMLVAGKRRVQLAFAAIVIGAAVIAGTLSQMITSASSETKGPFQCQYSLRCGNR